MDTNEQHKASDADLLREVYERAALVRISVEKTQDAFLEYLFDVFNLELSQRMILVERGYGADFKK